MLKEIIQQSARQSLIIKALLVIFQSNIFARFIDIFSRMFIRGPEK